MTSHISTPEEIYDSLFYDIHRQHIFADGKAFADARARLLPELILKKYVDVKLLSNGEPIDLRDFVNQYFELPDSGTDDWTPTGGMTLEEHVHQLWKRLERPRDKAQSSRSSKLALPHPYVVPGGRFNEIYYWDSYFTMLGLVESNRIDLVECMVANFRHLIDSFGHIPNGNRTYFLSRSQPPFYSLMVKLLIQHKGTESIPDYMSSMIREYNFWMDGIDMLEKAGTVHKRVAKVDSSYLLNRYYDAKDTPREEMYGDDWGLIDYDTDRHRPLFRDIRAACESGWDFSSRWLRDPHDLKSIHTTDLLPIDLNCLLWHLEQLISECYDHLGQGELSLQYGILANQRKKAIQSLFWDEQEGFFMDYNIVTHKTSSVLSLAGIFPLYFGLASSDQAALCKDKLMSVFLYDGGLVSTPYTTGQQWDAPNGWAPLQWMAIQGLLKYKFKPLAQEIAARWIFLNEQVYQRTGKMLEKYNVMDTSLEGGGGEYPVQDGFGWTNGVYLALKNG